MGNRSHVPFDVFAMRVEVPVSTAVRDGNLGWTCGQCPLTRTGDVFAPGALLAQTEFVCDMIETVVARAGFSTSSVGKLHVYLTGASSSEARKAEALIAARFAHGPLIMVINVPFFYYEGMLIEVDVFMSAGLATRAVHEADGVHLQVMEADSQLWVKAMVPDNGKRSPADRVKSIARALRQQGLDPDALLSDLWLVGGDGTDSRELAAAARDHRLMTNPDALVLMADPAPPATTAILTFTRQPVHVHVYHDATDGLHVSVRQCGPVAWVTGSCADRTRDLVGQTSAIMGAVDAGLRSVGQHFANVVKLTAHYTGDATEQDLHGNMKVRHQYYRDPGPASTGVPVHGLGHSDCRIAVDAHLLANDTAEAL